MQQVVAAMIEMDGYMLICRRSSASHRFPLKWEFPGGKVEPGESPENAIIREMKEELGIHVRSVRFATSYDHQYPLEDAIRLVFFFITEFSGTVQNRQFEQMAWVLREKLHAYDFLDGDMKIVKMLQNGNI